MLLLGDELYGLGGDGGDYGAMGYGGGYGGGGGGWSRDHLKSDPEILVDFFFAKFADDGSDPDDPAEVGVAMPCSCRGVSGASLSFVVCVVVFVRVCVCDYVWRARLHVVCVCACVPVGVRRVLSHCVTHTPRDTAARLGHADAIFFQAVLVSRHRRLRLRRRRP
jgi:hypothetical protein